MFRHFSRLTIVAFLALGALLAAACGDGGGPPSTAPAAPAVQAESTPAPPEAPEPVPAPPEPTPASPEPASAPPEPPEPAPAPLEPQTDEPSPEAAATEEPTPTTPTYEPVEETEADSPPDDGATEGPELEVAEAPAFPVTITSDGGTWTLEAAPQRIVSLSPAATEILFAIGAGGQVVAVDSWSTFPPEAPQTDLSGFDPNIEAVAEYEPDLVVLAFDTNDLVAGLTALDIPILLRTGPVDIEGGYAAVTELGLATGHITEAENVIATMRSEIATALTTAPDAPVRIYHELDQTYFSASSSSFIGAVYTALGAVNIADNADPEGYGYPQLTEEYIIEADPELIVITNLSGYTADDVTARAGWESISAVRTGNIITVDADVASRWGPRLPQFFGAIAEALTAGAETDKVTVG